MESCHKRDQIQPSLVPPYDLIDPPFRPVTFTSHSFPTSPFAAKMSAPVPRHGLLKRDPQREGLRHCFTKDVSLQQTPATSIVLERKYTVPAHSRQTPRKAKIATKYTKGLSMMLDILYSKFRVHHRHPTACRAPPTGNDRVEIKYGTDRRQGGRKRWVEEWV